MRIEITAAPSVADGKGRRYRTGQVVDVDEGLARAWVAAGHARRAGKQAAKRTATRPAPNSATAKEDGQAPTAPPGAEAGDE
jgi:hypothetical protein